MVPWNVLRGSDCAEAGFLNPPQRQRMRVRVASPSARGPGRVKTQGSTARVEYSKVITPLWVPLPHLLARAAHPIVAWEADRIALGVARPPTLAARYAPKVQVAHRSVGASN